MLAQSKVMIKMNIGTEITLVEPFRTSQSATIIMHIISTTLIHVSAEKGGPSELPWLRAWPLS